MVLTDAPTTIELTTETTESTTMTSAPSTQQPGTKNLHCVSWLSCGFHI